MNKSSGRLDGRFSEGGKSKDGSWTVTIDGLAAPEGPLTRSELASYMQSDEAAVKYFSRIATYTNTFTLGKKREGGWPDGPVILEKLIP